MKQEQEAMKKNKHDYWAEAINSTFGLDDKDEIISKKV